MKLNNFQERINSFYLLVITLFGYIFIFGILNFWMNLIIFIFILCLYLINDIKFIFLIKVLFGAILFSFFYSLVVLAFPNSKMMIGKIYNFKYYQVSEIILQSQLRVFYRIAMIATLSISSLFCIKFEKILINLMSKKIIPVKLGYPILLAFNSIGLLKTEFERIRTNAEFRNIGVMKRLDILFPLLVFSIRHSERGAMALVTRGLNENKSYYFDSSSKASDIVLLLSFCILYISLATLYLFN